MSRGRKSGPAKSKVGGGDARNLAAAGRQRQMSGRMAEAQDLYRRALEIDPREAEALHGLGMLAHMAGMHDHAIDLIGRAIAVDDRVAAFHNNIGEAYRALRRFDDAARHYRRALALAPDSPGTSMSLGMALAEEGQAAAAERAFRQVLSFWPDNGDALNALGNVLMQLDRIEDAIEVYRGAIAAQPGDPAPRANLAIALERSGRHGEASDAYREALALTPDDIDLLLGLGRVELAARRAESAIETYRRAVDRAPDRAEAHLGLANALLGNRRVEEAVAAYSRAHELEPDNPAGMGGLAIALERLHRLDEARAAVESLIETHPEAAGAQLAMAVLQSRAGDHGAARERLEALLARPLPAAALALGATELGHVLDRLGAYDAAFAAFQRGNEAAADDPLARDYDPAAYRATIARTRAWATTERFARWAGAEPEDGLETPIFFTGFPRSGTTLMESLLEAHPLLAGSDEAPLLAAVRAEARRQGGADWRYPEGIDTLATEAVAALRAHYWAAAREHLGEALDGRRLVDKLPLNLVHLALVFRLFPRAPVIVALRDPRDVCLSCFMQRFDPNDAMLHFLSLDTTAELYVAVMGLWRHYERTLPIRRLVYRYEDLVEEPKVVLGRVFDFLGLEWDEEALRRTDRGRRRAVSTPSYREVVKPINRSAVGRWRHYRNHLDPILPVLAPLVEAFGYGEAPAGKETDA